MEKFKIYGGRLAFYQWDFDQKLLVLDDTVTQVHFPLGTESCPPLPVYELDGQRVVDVPNILLQTEGMKRVYAFVEDEAGGRTICTETFRVNARPKPDDYIYTETELWTAEAAVQKALQEAKDSGDFKGDKGDKGDPGEPGKDGTDGKDSILIAGTGPNSAVFSEGAASGNTSIAGGTTDKSLIENIVSPATALLLPVPEQAEASGDLSMSLGAGTVAQSAGAIAMGINSIAGVKGYYMWSISGTTITLSLNQKTVTTILGTEYTNDREVPTALSWKVGQKVVMQNTNYYAYTSTITAVDTTNMTVTFDSLPFTSLTTKSLSASYTPHDLFICVPDAPEAGEIEMGFGAYARGYENNAVGIFATAIGRENAAIGSSAFVAGQNNVGARCAFVGGEGNTVTGNGASATGRNNTVTSQFGHVEGFNNNVSGNQSHAEGYYTTASGHNSHAEGKGTIAARANQHVQGTYNIEDTENKYAHIVGNGTDADNRSNAHTLDWSGNAWYAGRVEATALILKSPNGTRYILTAADDGTLTVTAAIT